MTAWVITNSLALLGIVFFSGQLVHRVKSLERRMDEAEERETVQSAQASAIAALTEQIKSLKEAAIHTSESVHDLRNAMLGMIGK